MQTKDQIKIEYSNYTLTELRQMSKDYAIMLQSQISPALKADIALRINAIYDLFKEAESKVTRNTPITGNPNFKTCF